MISFQLCKAFAALLLTIITLWRSLELALNMKPHLKTEPLRLSRITRRLRREGERESTPISISFEAFFLAIPRYPQFINHIYLFFARLILKFVFGFVFESLNFALNNLFCFVLDRFSLHPHSFFSLLTDVWLVRKEKVGKYCWNLNPRLYLTFDQGIKDFMFIDLC